ncbi:hypothetical protein F5887DRAFT_236274 [Amanita rubescens]|nr:hypothetical protein F5887DRAFT_236274 [Amanita rubescens]
MKSYTLANWDGSLVNGTSSSSGVRQDGYGVQAQATPDRPNGAFNVDSWKIPLQDTHHRYASGTGATDEWTEGRSGPNSRMNGIRLKPGDASLKASAKGRRGVNGYTLYKRNDGPSSAQTNTKQSPSSKVRLRPVPNGSSSTTSSRTFLRQTPPRTRATRRGQPLSETTVQNGRMIGDESLMDVDDVSSLSDLSSADAEGDEDEDEVSFVNDMLINEEARSKSPTTVPSDNREPPSPLSPLFTPPSAEMHLNTTSEKNSPVDLLTPPPDATPASTSQIVDTPSLTISAEGSQKQSVETTTKSGGKRPKRMMISHIAVPPLPASVSKGSYRSISSLPLKTQSKLMSRPAKVLAQIRVQKTLEDGVRVARQHNLNLGSVDDWRDPTYKPAPSAVSKNGNTRSSRASLRETAATSRRTSTPVTTINESSVVKPEADVETNISIVRTPTPPINPSHVVRTSTPQLLVLAAAPSSIQIRSSLPPLPAPGTGEKRKYQKRPKGEDVDSGKSKPKKTKVVRVDKGKETMVEVDAIQPKERPKKHRRVRASAYSRYNPELGVLQIFFHGIPTTRHSVLEMNIRHIRREKGVNEDEDGSQSVDTRLGMTHGHEISSSWFVWPPPDLDRDEEEYYAGGLLEELVDEEEDKLELRRTKVKHECCSTSYTIVSDEPSSILVEHEASPSPPQRSPTIVLDDDWGIEEGYTDQPSSRPSAKALGKRKATSSLHVGDRTSPVTPQRSTYELQDSGRIESGP